MRDIIKFGCKYVGVFGRSAIVSTEGFAYVYGNSGLTSGSSSVSLCLRPEWIVARVVCVSAENYANGTSRHPEHTHYTLKQIEFILRVE